MKGWMLPLSRRGLKTGITTASGTDMKSMTRLLGFLSCCALTACGPAEGESVASNLECAALISASTYLGAGSKAEDNPALTKRALTTSMTYLNAYAIPKGLKQKQAFAELTSVRKDLMESRSPGKIMSQPERCADRNPH